MTAWSSTQAHVIQPAGLPIGAQIGGGTVVAFVAVALEAMAV